MHASPDEIARSQIHDHLIELRELFDLCCSSEYGASRKCEERGHEVCKLLLDSTRLWVGSHDDAVFWIAKAATVISAFSEARRGKEGRTPSGNQCFLLNTSLRRWNMRWEHSIVSRTVFGGQLHGWRLDCPRCSAMTTELLELLLDVDGFDARTM